MSQREPNSKVVPPASLATMRRAAVSNVRELIAEAALKGRSLPRAVELSEGLRE